MEIIAKIYTDLPEKFGIPRQSALVKSLCGTIVFEKDYRVPEALAGLEDFSHLWLLWQFSDHLHAGWSPTVRPPRLGGEVRKGVFATRAPFRPNPIGLSCVKLEEIRRTADCGTVLLVSGVDMKSGTPIYDIKPYIPYTDSVPEATQGFAAEALGHTLQVQADDVLLAKLPPQKQAALLGILAQDPRPGYHNDPTRIYGVSFAGFNVKFRVVGDTLTVTAIEAETT